MIPNVFVSSTISDLHHLRDAMRDVVADLGYTPIMSEYGDIGYLPAVSVQESCYMAVRQCQMAILVIGRRYGEPKPHGLSVTHSEFHAARAAAIPVITLVDKDVMAFKAVADANPAITTVSFPGMDYPWRVFALLNEIAAYEINNGFLLFTTVADARQHIKHQLAHMFGDLIQRRSGGIAPDVKEILAEIKALRHSLASATDASVTSAFVRALRFLLEDKGEHLRAVVEKLFGDVEKAISLLLEQPTFETFVAAAGWQLIVDEATVDFLHVQQTVGTKRTGQVLFLVDQDDGDPNHAAWYSTTDRILAVNRHALDYFSSTYAEARSQADKDRLTSR